MITEMQNKSDVAEQNFPAAEVKKRILVELQKIADQGSILRPEWEPLLDSKRVVGTVLALEGLFPFEIPPDRVVQKGGYNTVDEAVGDMLVRIRDVWNEKNKARYSNEKRTTNSVRR